MCVLVLCFDLVDLFDLFDLVDLVDLFDLVDMFDLFDLFECAEHCTDVCFSTFFSQQQMVQFASVSSRQPSTGPVHSAFEGLRRVVFDRCTVCGENDEFGAMVVEKFQSVFLLWFHE